ncbi:Homogentisate 1,2-dioxygenase, partial [Fragariocoptes setiger]
MANQQKQFVYMNGFGNEFESEVHEPGIGLVHNLPPPGQLNPQRCSNNLYAEQLSGTAFTAPRAAQRRSWLYRVRPSCKHGSFQPYTRNKCLDFNSAIADPNQRRWMPFESPHAGEVNFIDGLALLGHSGDVASRSGSVAIYIYCFGLDMSVKRTCMQNSDGDMLLVPQRCPLIITTEFGRLRVEPKEICVIQQGMKFSIDIESKCREGCSTQQSKCTARGYLLEIVGSHFELPYLGPIGANGLANARDFQVPTAHVDADCRRTQSTSWRFINKFQNQLFKTHQPHTPYDVAAWLGNYAPYKYDLRKFVAMNTVTIDHPDPSIFTVLTAPSLRPGTALADFVIFPPRWEVAGDTFRPPYYHKNCMTEFMGLIEGQYQAKSGAFAPGGASLHPAMSGHGPDKQCYDMAISQTLEPRRVADNSLAFMFETCMSLRLTRWACYDCSCIDQDYQHCWADL